jgi:hypothetical protein
MTLHRVLTDVKNLSYLFIAFTESHMLQNLKLALGKLRTGAIDSASLEAISG